MSFQMIVPETLRRRLEAFADLLRSCREVYFAAFGDGLVTPAIGSRAEFDTTMKLFGPKTDWPEGAVSMPRDLAVKLIHQQADYCAAMGELVANDEVFDPLNSILRGAVEYAARAMWLLDPSTEDPERRDAEVGHRRRCARQLLMELVSVSHLKDSLSGLPGWDTEFANSELRWQELKQSAEARFDDVVIKNDPRKWSIEGEHYPTWTDATNAWAQANGGYIPGDAVYKLLAVDGHPQGFSATRGLVRGETGIERRIPIEDLANRVQLGVVSFYTSMMMLASYHGYESTVLSDWELRIGSVFPAALQ